MKKYITIKFEKEDFEHLKKWIKNTIEMAEYIGLNSYGVDWQKKMLEKIEKQEPTS